MTKELNPMSIAEAIEAMKIIVYFEDAIVGKERVVDVIKAIFQKAEKEGDTPHLLRLLALMQHRHVNEVVNEFKHLTGGDFVVALVDGFVANPIMDLLNSANILGIKTREVN